MALRAFSFPGVAVVISAVGTPAEPGFAHHSFAMFDGEKTQVLEGTVKEFLVQPSPAGSC